VKTHDEKAKLRDVRLVQDKPCPNCGTMLYKTDAYPNFRYDYLDSPNSEAHNFDRCRWEQAEDRAQQAHAAGKREGIEAAAKECESAHTSWKDFPATKPTAAKEYSDDINTGVMRCIKAIRALLQTEARGETCPRCQHARSEHAEGHGCTVRVSIGDGHTGPECECNGFVEARGETGEKVLSCSGAPGCVCPACYPAGWRDHEKGGGR
jgi:hypothetical protein